MSTPPSPNDLTRQQLDELDSLLQRMLSLPLSGPAEDAPPPPPLPPLPEPPAGWRADAGGPSVKPPHLAADPAPALAPAVGPPITFPSQAAARPAADEPVWGPDPLARYGRPVEPELDRPFGPPTPETGVPPAAPGPGTLRGVDAPALPAGFRSLFAEAEAEVERAAPLAPAPAAPPPVRSDSPLLAPRPSLPVWLWPVFAVNWVLELLLGLLGPVGAAATRPLTKHLLGFAGLVLLVAAGAWAARGMGWVHFSLPWPR
jgi:hypothetical protein